MSPKFGFAYNINDKMVLRGGYGINNMPPINNGLGGPSTIGYNGAIAVNIANTPLRFAEEPWCSRWTTRIRRSLRLCRIGIRRSPTGRA